ncbi:MAG: terminase small subunit [Clostridia bacterium]|nr:terminase small subunit [Clostridia bacterium]
MDLNEKSIEELEKQLNKKEREFCEYYLLTGKKGEAAEKAGYKNPSVSASRLLRKDKIIAYTRAIQKRAREELMIDINWSVLKTLEIYDRCMQNHPAMEWDYSEHKMVETGEYVFDSKGALGAVKEINRILGIGEDNGQQVDGVNIIDDMGGGKNG